MENIFNEVRKEILNQNDNFQELFLNEFPEYADNYYGEGTINLLGQEIEVESIWTDGANQINIHLNHKEFEGDVLLLSLSTDNQLTIIDMMEKHYLNLKEKGIVDMF